MKLHIGDGLSLPVEAVTQTFCILAKRGAGKSYTASVLAEEMLKAGQPVVAIDPTGAWWGLRSLYPVVIFGGEHADVPLEESAGEVVARSIVENRFPAVLDLSLFRKGQTNRFMVAFAETLYRLNREAVHLFVDEADAVAPQKPFGEEARMLGAMEDIVRRGRKRGIGCTLITQRAAVLNKNVLTQCEVLVALRTVHPRDIAAVEEWVNVHADPTQAGVMIASLPDLPIGEAWFWCPAWDLFKRVRVRERETFDSGATPKPGQAAKRPKHLAEIDIAALGEQIKATVEKAKADDPKELRKRIAELERQAKARPVEQVPVEKIVRVEVPVLENGQLDRTEKVIGRLEDIGNKALSEAAELKRLIAPAFAPKPTPSVCPSGSSLVHPPGTRGTYPAPKPTAPTGDGTVTPRQQRFLDAAATLTTLGVEVTRETVAAWVGVHPRGGSVGEELKALADAGLIELDRGRIRVTDAGTASAGAIDPTDAVERAKAGLTNRQRRFFDLIVAAYPGETTREAIAEAVGIHPRGGSLGEDLGRLVGRGLVDGTRGRYRARDFLFAGTT